MANEKHEWGNDCADDTEKEHAVLGVGRDRRDELTQTTPQRIRHSDDHGGSRSEFDIEPLLRIRRTNHLVDGLRNADDDLLLDKKTLRT